MSFIEDPLILWRFRTIVVKILGMIAETCKTEVGGVLFHALDEVGERAAGLRCPSDFGHPHETWQGQVFQMVCIGDVFCPERGLHADVAGLELCGHVIGNGQVIIHLLQVVSAASGAEVLAAGTAIDVVAAILSPVADDSGQSRLGDAIRIQSKKL